MSELTSKKCIPCEGDTPPFSKEEAEKYLIEVLGWNISGDYRKISRNFEFKNFREAMSLVNKVAELAEEEGHHPDILIHSWNKVRLELSTHAINGLSENDFIMAAKINAW